MPFGPDDPAAGSRTGARQRQMRGPLALLANGMDHINDSVLIVRAPGRALRGARVVLANAAFERQTGIPREQVVGQRTPILKRIVGARLFAHIRRHATDAHDSDAAHLEFLMPRADGTGLWMELDVVALENANEARTRYWIVMGRDITDPKGWPSTGVAINRGGDVNPV